ncbi:MAG: hypothetical protein O7C66_02725, partial [Alphaproteobacteria bacterium]|nr:hypothetical protein [Alphaproteobacteria bacterium]
SGHKVEAFSDTCRCALAALFPYAAGAILTRKTIAANAVIATVEKAMEVAGGGGFFRKTGIERLLRDAHGARYHPLGEKPQQRFSGRLALGLEPIGDSLEQALKAAAQ